jgi:hypothetical protein
VDSPAPELAGHSLLFSGELLADASALQLTMHPSTYVDLLLLAAVGAALVRVAAFG